MSEDEQESTWDKFVGDSKSFAGRLAPALAPSFDFAQGPTTQEQLLEWVDSPDYECPDVAHFNYRQVKVLIADCLADRGKVKHLDLPPVFWNLLDENLIKAEKLWLDTHSGQMGWPDEGLIENPSQRESVFTTAAQLHVLFSGWYSLFGESLNGTGDAIWEQVFAEVDFSEDEFDRVRVSVKGAVQPFFLWEVDYPFPEKHSSVITTQSPGIAAWFVLFSLHKVLRLFCLLVADVLRGPSEGDDIELRHSVFAYWADIQAALSVAQYWYDRIYSLDETLIEFGKRVSSEAETMTLEELEKTDAPLLHVGRLRLFNWFKNSLSSEAGFYQWQAFCMAKDDQLEPPNETEWDREGVRLVVAELHCSFQTAVMKLAFDQAVADFRKSHPYEKKLLSILDHKDPKPTANNVEALVTMLIGNEAGSAKTSFSRARKEFADYRENAKSFRKEFSKNKDKARAKLISG
ncbi:MAG: hypothetical protein DCE87_05660 [Betaproteobacteria bacterium]|jgi:hypothetical protein|nr:MAG: hypothetical protein DCE87_05660 [Betaproteobacteria bacterium]PZO25457.1 MAG: hypothetical protein DCE89_03030 [Betaproteobacteria bacterium]PZO26827.1 MAG: hypothetical protein DCE88_11480 [Betaproteobacteria bacterium]